MNFVVGVPGRLGTSPQISGLGVLGSIGVEQSRMDGVGVLGTIQGLDEVRGVGVPATSRADDGGPGPSYSGNLSDSYPGRGVPGHPTPKRVTFYTRGPAGSVLHREMKESNREKLSQCMEQLKREIDPDAHDLTLDMSKKTAIYTCSDGAKIEVDLLKEATPTMQALIDKIDGIMYTAHPPVTKGPAFENGYKGLKTGPMPLQRTTAELKKLPGNGKDFVMEWLPSLLEVIPSTRQHLAVQRVHAAEVVVKDHIEYFTAELNRLDGDLKKETDPHKRSRLENEKQRIAHNLKQWKEVDMFALQYALALHEEGGDYVKEALSRQLQVQSGSAESVFAADIGGMMMPDRLHYMEFCRQHGMAIKQITKTEEVMNFVLDLETGRSTGFLPPGTQTTVDLIYDTPEPHSVASVKKALEAFRSKVGI